MAPTTTGEGEEEEEEPQKKGCSIWCWIQKIAMFVISQLLSGNCLFMIRLKYHFDRQLLVSYTRSSRSELKNS